MSSMKLRSITILVAAEILAMTMWFVSSAIIGDISSDYELTPALSAMLSSSVQFGFVVGAILAAISGIADRYDPRKVFAIFALTGALANLVLLVLPPPSIAICIRFITGFCLAGVYPVGMKIAVGWGTRDRGLLVGLLVGGLTLGSAAPHLLAFLGGTKWQLTLVLSSALAASSAFLILLSKLGPHHATAAKFDPRVVFIAWTDKRIRLAFAGYFGHMWELYAMWAWIGTAAAASYALQTNSQEALELGKLTAFSAIAAGALFCPLAGIMADRTGKARLTIIAMAGSGLAALLAALTFGGPIWVFFLVSMIWGICIIPDSAQFSALVADYASPQNAGSLLTLQTSLGFALTILTVQATPMVADAFGWPVVFLILAAGPALGILAMRPLRNLQADDDL